MPAVRAIALLLSGGSSVLYSERAPKSFFLDEYFARIVCMNKTMLLLAFSLCVHAAASAANEVNLVGLAEHFNHRTPNQVRLDQAATFGNKHFASGWYFGFDYLSDMIKALALRFRNPDLMRLAYTISGGMKALNAASSLTSAVAPLVPSQGYNQVDGRIMWRRLLAGLCAIDDVTGAARSFEMVGRSGILSRLYKQKPDLRKQLNRTSNKRLTNRSIGFAIALALYFALKKLSPNGVGIQNWILASIVYDISTQAVMDRQSEDAGLEDRLLKQAKRELKKEKKEQKQDDDELAELEAKLLHEEGVA